MRFFCHVTTWFNSHLVSRVEPLHLPSLEAIGLAEKEMLCFKFFIWPTRLRSQRVMWLHGWLSVTIRHYPDNSGGIGLVGEDIKFLNWHETSCDHVMRVVWLHYELSLTIRQHPAKFAGHTPSEGRNISFLISHVTSCNQVVRGICENLVPRAILKK